MSKAEMERAGQLFLWAAETFPAMKAGEFMQAMKVLVMLERAGIVVWVGVTEEAE